MATARAAGATPPGIATEVGLGEPCLDRESFERALFARTTRPRGAGGDQDTSVRVSVERAADGYLGTIAIAEPGDAPRVRAVRGATCDEVALSLVLVAALALEGALEPGETPPTTFDPADLPPVDPPPAATAPPPEPGRAITVGAHVGAELAGGDGPSPAGDVFAGVASTREGFSPGLRVALGAARSQVEKGDALVRVTPVTLRIEPTLLQLGEGAFRARLGPIVEGGLAFAAATPVDQASPATRPWLRGGAAVQIAVRIGGALGLELDGGMLAPFVRDAFVVAPARLGYRVPWVAPFLRLGLLFDLRQGTP
jgi:hypothetical protein